MFEVNIKHVFKFPWNFVTHTHLTKYPTDKEETVLRMDTIETYTDLNGVQYSRRIAICKNILPEVLRRIDILNEDNILLEEECWYDSKLKTMKVKSRNITWDRYANAWEESEFKCSKENPNWTSMDQRGGVCLKYLGPIARMAEMFIYSYVKSSSWKAIHVMEELLEERAELCQKTSGRQKNFTAEQTTEVFSY